MPGRPVNVAFSQFAPLQPVVWYPLGSCRRLDELPSWVGRLRPEHVVVARPAPAAGVMSNPFARPVAMSE